MTTIATVVMNGVNVVTKSRDLFENGPCRLTVAMKKNLAMERRSHSIKRRAASLVIRDATFTSTCKDRDR